MEQTTTCPNCGHDSWITRERSDGTKITRCAKCNCQRDVSQTPKPELRIAAIVRADLNLPAGKMAAQVGHAFLSAFQLASRQKQADYIQNAQAKLVLIAPNLTMLQIVQKRAIRRSISSVMITDAGRTVLSEPTITALGVGPMTKTDSNAITRGLEMME